MDITRPVKFLLPTNFVVPNFYTNATPAQRGMALQIGADAMLHLQKRAMETVRAETHAETVRKMAEEYEIKQKEAGVETAASMTKLQTQLQKSEEALRLAKARLEALEAAAEAIRADAQKDARASIQDLVKSKDDQIQRLQATLEKQLELVTTKMEGLQHTMTKTFSSSKEKGSFGEALMENFIKRAFDCDVNLVSKEAQTADIRMTRKGGHQYFWEVKNYTRMINPDEIEKFRRDLRLHPDVKGGIFVSLRTGIVGKGRSGDIEMEFLEDGRPIVFLSHFMSREDPVYALQALRPFFDMIEMVSKPVKSEGEAVMALQAKAALVTNLLQGHALSVGKYKNSLAMHRKRMDSMFSEFQVFVMEAEAQLQVLLRVALGTEEETGVVQEEVETVLNPALFKKEKLSDYADGRMKDFIKWLLSATEAQEGAQMETKELLEKAKSAGYAEKWVRGLREEVFQESAWPKNTRFMHGVRLVQAPTLSSTQ